LAYTRITNIIHTIQSNETVKNYKAGYQS
jgi:hypothetical protein